MGIKPTAPKFQSMIDAAVFRQTQTVNSKQATSAAQNSGAVGQKKKDLESDSAREGSTLSEAAQRAIQQDNLDKDLEQAKAGLAGKAAEANKGNEVKKRDDDKKLKFGGVEQGKESVTFASDDDDETPYEVSINVAAQYESVSSRTSAEILADMPESSKLPSEAMVKAQGPKKLAKDLKDDPKVTAQVEVMKLGLSDINWKESALAPLHTGLTLVPMQLEDEHSEHIVKEAARQQVRNGNLAEQLIGS